MHHHSLQRLAVAIDEVQKLQSQLSEILRDLKCEANQVVSEVVISGTSTRGQMGLRDTAEDYLQADKKDSQSLVFSPAIKMVSRFPSFIDSFRKPTMKIEGSVPSLNPSNDPFPNFPMHIVSGSTQKNTPTREPTKSQRAQEIQTNAIAPNGVLSSSYQPSYSQESESSYTNSLKGHISKAPSLRREKSLRKEVVSKTFPTFSLSPSSTDSIQDQPPHDLYDNMSSPPTRERRISFLSSMNFERSDESLKCDAVLEGQNSSSRSFRVGSHRTSSIPAINTEPVRKKVQIAEEKSSTPMLHVLPLTLTGRARRQSVAVLEKIMSLDPLTYTFLIPAYDHQGCKVNIKLLRETDLAYVTFRVNGVHPRSLFFNVWDLATSLATVLIVHVIPFIIAFNSDYKIVDMRILSIFISIWYAADSIIAIITPLVPATVANTHNLAEYERVRPTLTDWIYKWSQEHMFMHILTVIPFESIFISLEYSELFLFLRLLRVQTLRLSFRRCPSIRRLAGIVDERLGTSTSQIAPITFAMIFFVHLNACIMYYVGRIYKFQGWKVFWPRFDQADLIELYTWVFFKSVGNLFPSSFVPWNIGEQIATMIFIMAGAIVYAVFLGAISSATLAINPSGRLYTQKIGELKDYIRWKNLSKETESKLLAYYETKYHGKYFEEDQILMEMNDSLRAEVSLHNTQMLIKRVPFLQRAENDGRDEIYFGRIAMALHSQHFIPGDFVLKQGDNANEMFFILTGKVDVLVDGRKVVSLLDGAYFGEMALITTALRTASIQAVLPSEMYRLTRIDFHALLEDFRDMKVKIEVLAEERRQLMQQKK